MGKENIRVGRISSIDYKKGMVKVIYADRDDAVTDDLPYLSMNSEYKMPSIDDMVLVLHLSNGMSVGVALGTFWSESNLPLDVGKGIYKKEYAANPGEAFTRYDEGTKTLVIKADHVKIETLSGTFTVQGGA